MIIHDALICNYGGASIKLAIGAENSTLGLEKTTVFAVTIHL